MKEKARSLKSNESKKQNLGTAEGRSKKRSNAESQERTAAAGEVQYAGTIGRHGTEEESTLNPEE